MDAYLRQLIKPSGETGARVSARTTQGIKPSSVPLEFFVQRYTAQENWNPRVCSLVRNVLLVFLELEGSDRPRPCRFKICPLAVLQDHPEACP